MMKHSKIKSYLSHGHSLEHIKTFLLYELSPIRIIHLNFKGKYKSLYSDEDKFYGQQLVRCYFPSENICLIMSLNDGKTFPVISSILSNSWKENVIQTKIFHPTIRQTCNGPKILILTTDLESIIHTNGKTLKNLCQNATGIY